MPEIETVCFPSVFFACLSPCVFLLSLVGGGGRGWLLLGGRLWYNVGMAKDWITFKLSELDPSLLKVLSDWSGGRDARNSHNALELARLFVLWFLFQLKRLPVILKYVVPSVPKEVKEVTVEHLKALLGVPKKKSVVVRAPRYRAFRKGYYAWVKYVDLPRVPWVLITLTLSRSVLNMQDAWAYISKQVSDFLHRFRVYLRKVKRFTEFHYLWVLEPHQDGYPHVHILASFPFVDVEQIYSWWKSEGVQLSAFQGVDVEFIGRDVERVKAYVLEYLVKNHDKYWRFYLRGDEVTVRLSTLLMWYFRVPLLGMSRSIRALARALRARARAHSDGSEFGVFVGISDFWHVWRLLYKPLKIPISQFFLGFLDCGGIERPWVLVYSLLVQRYAKIV
jgi:hypothetical protein